MRKLLFLLLTIFISITTFANNNDESKGTIEGVIKTSDLRAAQGVTVRLINTKKITVSDEDGRYILSDVAPGHYTIEASLVGHGDVQMDVDVVANKTSVINFDFPISDKDLKDVIVTANQHQYTKNESDDVAKMPLKNLENPQVYSTVTKQLISDQMLTSVDAALNNATGVQMMWQATGRSGDGGAYYNSRGFVVQSNLRNGVAGIVSNANDVANVESVEVLKGPSATLFGSVLTSFGGLINRVTKKPYDTFGGEVSESAGSYDFSRTSLDINTPLDNAKKVLFRLNTAYNYQGTFQTVGFSRTVFVAPSLLIKANDRLSFSLDVELSYGKNIGQQGIFFYFPSSQLGYTNANQVPIDYKNSYIGNGLTQQSKSDNYYFQAKYKISNSFTSSTNFAYSHSYSNGFDPYFYLVPNALATGDAANTSPSTYLARADQSTFNNSYQNDIEVQENINGDFRIGSLRNRLLIGLDYTRINDHSYFKSNAQYFDIVPINVPGYDYNGFNGISLKNYYDTASASSVQSYPEIGYTNDYSAYVSDVLNLTEKLSVLAALRADHFDGNISGSSIKQTVLSPKFGIVYQPVLNVLSLFANYQNSFLNGQIYTAYDPITKENSAKISKPEQANQWEAGIKTNLMNNVLNATLSYYDISVSDVLRPDLSDPSGKSQLQDGTQLSRGVEFDLNATPFNGLDVLGGLSYNDSKMEKSSSDVEGRRPSTASSPWLAHWWLSYAFQNNNALSGLRLGFGGNYASDNRIVNSVSMGKFILPAYTIMNAAVSYDYKKIQFGIKVNNLTNKKYWIGYATMNPQMLRQFVASVSYKF